MMRDDLPVIVVDDDEATRRLMAAVLERAGHPCRALASGAPLLAADLASYGAVCLDLGFNGDAPDGHAVLEAVRARDPELPVVIVTGDGTAATAVSMIRAGAYDYLTKPVAPDRLSGLIERAVERRRLALRVRELERALQRESALIGQSPAMDELRRQIGYVVATALPVAVLGETGTGKELVAREIEARSSRRAGPLVAINCAAISPALQESELFGHERGAFTGAHTTHRGRFEQASGGTLFLDEIGEMSLATQATLLRTLQERTVRRVGGATEIAVDVRVVSATHRDLEREVAAGRFREDLYYRLVGYPIHTPPLRARKEDLPLLVEHFLSELGGDRPRGLTDAALDAMLAHDWPGNVRELHNVVQRAALACPGALIERHHLPRALLGPGAPAPPPAVGAPTREVVPLRELERREIAYALERTRGNVTVAARMLGIGRATLYRRLAELDLQIASAPAGLDLAPTA